MCFEKLLHKKNRQRQLLMPNLLLNLVYLFLYDLVKKICGKENRPTNRAVFLSELLFRCALHVDGAWSFFRIFHFERHFVAFVEFLDGDIDEGRHVEKHIFITGLRGNESKALFVDTFDCTQHRNVVKVNYQQNFCLRGKFD